MTGQARYAADMPLSNMAYGVLVTSDIARGRVRSIDLAPAKATPGVLDIVSYGAMGGTEKPQFGSLSYSSFVIEEYAEFIPDGAPPDAVQKLYEGKFTMTGGPEGTKAKYAYGAEFVEVRINARTGEIRVPRLVGAFAAGRIMNTRTARSQLMGGLIWGMSAALLEAAACAGISGADADREGFAPRNAVLSQWPPDPAIGQSRGKMVRDLGTRLKRRVHRIELTASSAAGKG